VRINEILISDANISNIEQHRTKGALRQNVARHSLAVSKEDQEVNTCSSQPSESGRTEEQVKKLVQIDTEEHARGKGFMKRVKERWDAEYPRTR
jgi:hypothetical protein